MIRSRQRRSTKSVSVAFVSVLLWAAPAAAESNGAAADSRQTQERTARKACLSGDYGKGVDILSELFVSTMDLTYIFNQGRCFEQNRRYEDAIARFHEYLKAGEGRLGQADRTTAEQHIADCKEMLAQERKMSPASAAARFAPQPSVPPTTPEPSARPEPSPIVAQPAAPPIAPGHRLRLGGIIVASLGAGAVGVGLLLNLKANSVANEMRSTTDGYAKEPDRQRYETLSWVGYGVGMGCILTGAILYGVGLRARSSSSTSLTLAPMVGAGQAGAVVAGGFQ